MGKKQKKNSCKRKCQEKKFVQRRRERKKFMQKEGPIVIFIQYIKSAKMPIKNSSYSKYSWGPTPGPPILLIINKDI